MTRDFPAFPAGGAPPSNDEVAAMLASGLPERDRAAAVRLLVDEILPWDLRSLAAEPSASPEARATAHAAYNALANQLGEVAPDGRLARLATIACSRRGDRLTGQATALAVARYVADHGRPRSNQVAGYLDEARPYLAMTQDQRLAEADRIDRELAEFERAARADRGCYERQRIPLVHARRALASARSGRFEVATGALYTFLRHAGENPQRIDPH